MTPVSDEAARSLRECALAVSKDRSAAFFFCEVKLNGEMVLSHVGAAQHLALIEHLAHKAVQDILKASPLIPRPNPEDKFSIVPTIQPTP